LRNLFYLLRRKRKRKEGNSVAAA